MDKPTARIIAVADKGGVAGARGAGHHLTEEATKEPKVYVSLAPIGRYVIFQS